MFSVVHANHIEDLRDLALQLIARDPLPPLEEETFLVQSSGMGQWLQMAIAEQQGIAASLAFILPASFVWQAYRCVLGDTVPKQAPFDRGALVWRLMKLFPQLLDDPVYAPLKDYLSKEMEGGRPLARHCYQLAERLAALYDQYLVYRPDWIEAWSRGEKPVDLELGADQQWQPELWRALLASANSKEGHLHRAALQQQFIARVNALNELPSGLPRRLFVFGISALPMAIIEALHALGRHMDIVLLVTNPSRFYWGDIVSERESVWRDEQSRRRHPERPGLMGLGDVALHLRTNPLLSSWGIQGRDFIQALYSFEQSLPFDVESDIFLDWAEGDKPALLHQIQQDVLDLVHPGERVEQEHVKREISATDDSIRLVACHSPLREIEILHDLLLDGFERDASLEPRDIIVQVPDIDRYTPFIEAVFSRYDRDDSRYIPFSIADRRASQASPLLVTAVELLSIPERRISVSEVLDWLDIPAFRRRFSISAEDMDLLSRWIEQSGIRWGLSARHRAQLGLPGLELNTWRFGLQRMLLGYAMGDVQPASSSDWEEVDPFDEVQGLDAALVGHLIDVIDALEYISEELMVPCTPDEWIARVDVLVVRFFEPRDEIEFDTLGRLVTALEQWGDSCQRAGYDDTLPLEVVRDAVISRLDEGGLSPRFLAGRVNFATLMPMRAIPFRHVYLLGMNDGEYPRPRMAQDFDLMAEHPRSGDRSRRDDDRYLMLEALLAARERLTISWIGFEQSSNQPRPYSVLVSELLDVVTKGWCIEGDQHSSDNEQQAHLHQRLIQHHPLQPFSLRYFEYRQREHKDQWPQLFSYDDQWLPHQKQQMTAPELAVSPQRLTLISLASLLRHPYSVCLSERLSVRFVSPEEVIPDTEPFELDGLEENRLKRQLLDGLVSNVSLSGSAERMQYAGRLPALGFGQVLLDSQIPAIEQQWQDWTTSMVGLRPLPPESAVWNADNITLEERIGNLYAGGDGGIEIWRLEAGVFSDVSKDKEGRLKSLGKPHRLLRLHLEQLLFAASHKKTIGAHAVFEDRILHLPRVSAAQADDLLREYSVLWQQAWCTPFPAILELSLEYLKGACSGDPATALSTVRKMYEEGGYNHPAIRDRYPALADLWPDFSALESAGFVAASERLYAPLFELIGTLVP